MGHLRLYALSSIGRPLVPDNSLLRVRSRTWSRVVTFSKSTVTRDASGGGRLQAVAAERARDGIAGLKGLPVGVVVRGAKRLLDISPRRVCYGRGAAGFLGRLIVPWRFRHKRHLEGYI